ncbi:MAG: hypothetical protein ACTHU0_25760, partial [Kofleriaceae bacterium]
VQPGAAAPQATADVLRDANLAASAGDWPRVAALVEPLLGQRLAVADLAEAHRLAGLAAFFLERRAAAEAHFVAWLRIDLDGRLDPALHPPEVTTFLDDVRTRHAAELRARRPRPRRYWWLNLVPPGGQIQNGERAKAYVVGGLLGTFAAANLTTYFVLRSWCTRVSGPGGESVTCDDKVDRASTAAMLRTINLVAGVGLIATYVYGVYDGARGYRRAPAVLPYVAPAEGGGAGLVGLWGSF